MAKDIEEFLKMAAERRKAAQQGQAAPPAGKAPTLAAPPQTPQRTSPPQQKKQRPPSQSSSARPVVERGQVEVVKRRESVAEHVQSHINTQRLTEHSASLGQQVGLADDKLAARLQETFDHEVGSLAGKDVRGGSAQPAKRLSAASPAETLRAMLADKASLQQAIILNEIFRRPEW